jgi:hypothetical protein
MHVIRRGEHQFARTCHWLHCSFHASVSTHSDPDFSRVDSASHCRSTQFLSLLKTLVCGYTSNVRDQSIFLEKLCTITNVLEKENRVAIRQPALTLVPVKAKSTDSLRTKTMSLEASRRLPEQEKISLRILYNSKLGSMVRLTHSCCGGNEANGVKPQP